MSETAEARLKRMKLRSMRRGIKEMDLILGGYADRRLAGLGEAQLAAYDLLLEENDHDLYRWVSGGDRPPAALAELIDDIARDAGAR